jgi:phenylpyruvate tautomerase PptA (4-oxalocrotonate tautomerase family)
MPTYACSVADGRLTPAQKLAIAESITAIHHEETGAPRYLVQVIFYDIAPGNHYISGQLAPAGQIWIRGDIRDGRTEEQKSRMLSRILQAVSRTSAISEDEVWVYLPTYRRTTSPNTVAFYRTPEERTIGLRRSPVP